MTFENTWGSINSNRKKRATKRKHPKSEIDAWWRRSEFDVRQACGTLWQNRKFMRAQHMRMIERLQPTLMVTFNFGYQIKPIDAQGRIHKFFNMTQRRALGR